MTLNGNNNIQSAAFLELKNRCTVIFEADPSQVQSDASLYRFLRAFKNVDDAFKAILKCNKWRRDFGVVKLGPHLDSINKEMLTGKVMILRHRDVNGRPIIYICVRKHNAYERNLENMTSFIVYILEVACKKCHEDIIDNLCIVFDMKDFTLSCMDYEFIKKLIWLLSKYYPERLGSCLVINAPMVFWGCWSIIKPWLYEGTVGKVTFVNDEKTLCKYLCPDVLPE